jgi:tetratricopeptide (TPR) repeat protein
MISLGRRIFRLPTMMVTTCRSDEVGPSHPLRRFLGSLSSRTTTRIDLKGLSPQAIRELAGSTLSDAEHLHELTGGNAFFVTEVLANPGGDLPPTVKDAVLGRMSFLSPDSREIVELISVAPGRFSVRTLLALRPHQDAAIEQALSLGILRSDGETVHYRHELARISVYDSLPPIRRLLLHRQLLDHLLAEPETDRDLAAIVHHGCALSDVSIIRTFAPVAARTASRTGAHLEALEHYRTTLQHESAFTEAELAEILEGLSFEIYLTGHSDDAIPHQERALGLRQAHGQALEAGNCLRWISRLHWFSGRNDEARRYAAQAVALLETMSPSRELAMAYSNRSQLAMLESRLDSSQRWGERAIALATSLDDPEVLAHAKTNVGLARMIAGDPAGPAELEEALAICFANEFHEHAVRALVGLSSGWITNRDYDHAFRYLYEGLEYCRENDLDSWSPYLEAYLARAEMETGNWESAAARARTVVALADLLPITRVSALVPLGLIEVRRGQEEGWGRLEEALRLAEPIGELQRLGPVVSALSEAAWLRGSFDGIRETLVSTFDLSLKRDRLWSREELAYWIWKSGTPVAADGFTTPWGLQIERRWREAAESWQRIGCPWERAMALAEGDENAVEKAISIMRELGSETGARAVLRDAENRR